MDAPLKVDYPTDDDSDDNVGFSLKIPDLSDLINEFRRMMMYSIECMKQINNIGMSAS